MVQGVFFIYAGSVSMFDKLLNPSKEKPKIVVRVKEHRFFRADSMCVQKVITKLVRKSTTDVTLKEEFDHDAWPHGQGIDNLDDCDDGIYVLTRYNESWDFVDDYEFDGWTLTPYKEPNNENTTN